MSVVRVNHSPKGCVVKQWNDVLAIFKKNWNIINQFATILQSKAIVRKSLLLSKLNYICNGPVMPASFKNSINKLLLKFFIPYNVSNMSEEQID